VPRDLETICLKCLAKEPAKRYASAEALADDLRRYLNDEPIKGRPVGSVERFVKWTRRRPALAALVAVSIVAPAALLVLGIWSYAKVTAREQEAQLAREQAEKRSSLVRRAVEDMYTQVAEKWLADAPQQDALQREFLGKALDIYRQLAQEESTDPVVRKETALAYFRLGQINRKLDQPDRAEQEYGSAISIQEELSREYPSEPGYRQDLGNSYNWRGELRRANGQRLHESREDFLQARAIQERLVEQDPREPSYRLELARSSYNLGILGMDTGRPGEAEKDYGRAVELLQALKERHSEVPEYAHELARAHLDRGILFRSNLARAKEAERDYDQAIDLYRQLVVRHPYRRDYRYEKAVSHLNRGNLLLGDKERRVDAESSFREAFKLLEPLVRESPDTPLYQYELANYHNSLASLMAMNEARRDEAEQEWMRALGIFQELANLPSARADYQSGLGRTLGNLGWLRLQREDFTGARADLEKGIGWLRKALQPNPDNPGYRQALRNQHRDLAEACLRLGEHGRAAAAAVELPGMVKNRGQDYYLAARLLARCIPLAENDENLENEAGRKRVAQKYGDQAVQFLRQAKAKGYEGLSALRGHPDLKPLEGHDGFVELFGTVEAPQ
jgi:tetratricopeptide (TPR) repeat protein